jgi:hypothetical protein
LFGQIDDEKLRVVDPWVPLSPKLIGDWDETLNTIRQLLQYNRRGRFDRHFATPKPQNALMLPWPKDFIYVFEKPKVTFGGATCITRVSGDYVSFDVGLWHL